MKAVRNLIAGFVLCALCAVPCGAADPYFISDQTISVTSAAAVQLNPPATATQAVVTVTLGDPVMWRMGTPTATVGHALPLNGSVYLIDQRDLRRFRAIAKTGGPHSVTIDPAGPYTVNIGN